MASVLDRLVIVGQELETPRPPMRFSAQLDGEEIGRARLYEIRNDIHPDPRDAYGYVEDVSTDPRFRRQGVANAIMEALDAAAEEAGFYKNLLSTEHANKAAMLLYLQRDYMPRAATFRRDLRKPYS